VACESGGAAGCSCNGSNCGCQCDSLGCSCWCASGCDSGGDCPPRLAE
jgi:hypothetical protein